MATSFRQTTSFRFLVFLFLVLVPSLAHASDPAPGDGAAMPPSEDAPALDAWGTNEGGSRFRLSYDLGVTGGLSDGTSSGSEQSGMGSLMFGLDLGGQFNQNWALYWRGEGGFSAISNYVGMYVMAEVTPVRVFSLGFGLGAEGIFNYLGTTLDSYGAVNVPFHFKFNLKQRARENSGSAGWRAGVLVLPGYDPSSDIVSIRGALTFGYAYM